MEKKLTNDEKAEIFHLYNGSQVRVDNNPEHECYISGVDGFNHCIMSGNVSIHFDKCKLLLRPLSDMKEEEADEIWELMGWNEKVKSNRKYHIISEFDVIELEVDRDLTNNSSWKYFILILPYLLKKGFDLFSLIPSGIALDKTQNLK